MKTIFLSFAYKTFFKEVPKMANCINIEIEQTVSISNLAIFLKKNFLMSTNKIDQIKIVLNSFVNLCFLEQQTGLSIQLPSR